MSSRCRSRLVLVPLVILAAFTGQWAGFAAARATQVTICAAHPDRSQPHLAPERPASPIPLLQPAPPEAFERQPNPPDFFIVSERFQRPPPSALSSLA
jgi:hypothetical protein